MDRNQLRASGSDPSDLGWVPAVPPPAKNEMKACAGEFLLKIRLAAVVLDRRVRKPISSLWAYPKPGLAYSDSGTVPVPNPKLGY